MIFWLLGLACFLVVLALVVCSAVDLVVQPARVPLWWGAPVVICWTAGQVYWLWDLDLSQMPSETAFIQGATLWLCSLTVVWTSVGFSLARGLRPGGETERHWFTTLVGTAGLVLVMLGFATIVGLVMTGRSAPEWLRGTPEAVLVVAVVAALWWATFLPSATVGLVLLDRSGAVRVENGRRAWLGSMAGATIAYWVGLLLLLLALPSPLGAVQAEIGILCVFVVLTTALPFLFAAIKGPLALGPTFLGASTLLTLGLLAIVDNVWSPITWEVDVPVYVDLQGRHRRPERINLNNTCVSNPKTCIWNEGMVHAFDADTALSLLGTDLIFAVDEGRGIVQRHVLMSCFDVSWDKGLALTEDGQRLPVGPELHGRLAQLEDEVLCVRRTPRWTLQQFVSMCASSGTAPSCDLVP